MIKICKKVFIFSLTILNSTVCFAQFHNERFLRTQLTLTYENQLPRDFDTVDSKYKSAEYALAFKQPIINRVTKGGDQGTFKLTGLQFNLKASRTDLVMNFLKENHKLYHVGGGFNFIYFPGRKILYLANFNTNIFQDNYVSGISNIRYSGFFLLNYKASKIVSLKAGLAYSYLYGRGRPLPMLGAGFRFKTGTDINILLPFYFNVIQKLNSKSKLTLSLKPSGSVYDFSNKGNFIGDSAIVQFRQRSFKGALNYTVEFYYNIKFLIEGGMIGRSSISFSDGNFGDKKNFYETDIENGFYGKAGLIFNFGEEPKWGKQNGVNFMLDNDVIETEVRE